MSFWRALTSVPVNLCWRDVDGVSTRLLELGDPESPPVVFLHGVGGHLEAFAYNLAGFAADHHVIAYDLPGHGYSSAPAERCYEIAGYVTHLLALLDSYRHDCVDLVGVSLGGWIAARTAVDHPHRVGRLVLVGTGGATYDEAVMSSITTLSTAAAADPSPANVRARLEWLMADPHTVSDELVEVRQAIYAQPRYASAMERVLCLQQPDIRRANLIQPDEWAAIEQPTLVVWGTHDRTAGPSKGREIARSVRNGSFVELADAGHWPQFEMPEAFNEAVDAHLTAPAAHAAFDATARGAT